MAAGNFSLKVFHGMTSISMVTPSVLVLLYRLTISCRTSPSVLVNPFQKVSVTGWLVAEAPTPPSIESSSPKHTKNAIPFLLMAFPFFPVLMSQTGSAAPVTAKPDTQHG